MWNKTNVAGHDKNNEREKEIKKQQWFTGISLATFKFDASFTD